MLDEERLGVFDHPKTVGLPGCVDMAEGRHLKNP